jgi:hypothetical protein
MPRPTTPNSANAFQSYKVTSIPSEPVVVPDERLFPFPASISCERTRGTSNTPLYRAFRCPYLDDPFTHRRSDGPAALDLRQARSRHARN